MVLLSQLPEGYTSLQLTFLPVRDDQDFFVRHVRTPAGFVQPSPWLGISNRNLELVHKFMSGPIARLPHACR